MSEKTRQMVWEEIQASELAGSDVVPLSIGTVKLLLRCARFVNEVAAQQRWGTSRNRVHAAYVFVLSNEEVRDKAKELEGLL